MDIIKPYKKMNEYEKGIVREVNKKEKRRLKDYYILYNTFGFGSELRVNLHPVVTERHDLQRSKLVREMDGFVTSAFKGEV